MAETTYKIYYSDTSKTPITVNEIVGNTDSCSLELIGKKQPVYGEAQNTDYLHLLENFASSTAPNKPTEGQLWCEKNNTTGAHNLKMYDGSTWVKMPRVVSSTTQPEIASSEAGDLWYDTANHQFAVYDNTLTKWVVIGPIDYSHKINKVYETMQVNSNAQKIKISKSLFGTNVNSIETTSLGSVTYLNMKIISKEVYNSLEKQGTKYPRCKTWNYKFSIQSVVDSNDETSYDIGLIGSPICDVISQSNNTTNWETSVTVENTTNDDTGSTENMVVITLNTPPTSDSTGFISYVVSYIGIEMEKA